MYILAALIALYFKLRRKTCKYGSMERIWISEEASTFHAFDSEVLYRARISQKVYYDSIPELAIMGNTLHSLTVF